MSRRRTIYENDYRYLDHQIILDRDGHFSCPDMRLTDVTLEGLKAQMKALQVKRESKPRIDVWFYDQREDKWMQGTTTGAPTGWQNGEVVVMWPEKARFSSRATTGRRNIDRDYVYLVNDANNEKIALIQHLEEQQNNLNKSIQELKESLQGLPDPDKE